MNDTISPLSNSVRVLVVDDYETWRQSVRSILIKHKRFHIVAEVADGLEGVQKAQELLPDLILLDIGLPQLNGIEAARRIREYAPDTKILFLSENRSWDVAEEALRAGGDGYVVKSDAGSELVPAVETVLRGRRFISPRLAGHALTRLEKQSVDHARRKQIVAPLAPQNMTIRHELEFYPDDAALVDSFARLTKAALMIGSAVVAIATEAHRAGILQKLRADGVDVDRATRDGSFIALDVIDTLSTVMVDYLPDPVRCAKAVDDVVRRASKGLRAEHARVAICGEVAPTLLADGNAEAAIRLEHLWDEITKKYRADTLCGYVSSAFPQEEGRIFERICAEHSAIHGRTLGYSVS